MARAALHDSTRPDMVSGKKRTRCLSICIAPMALVALCRL